MNIRIRDMHRKTADNHYIRVNPHTHAHYNNMLITDFPPHIAHPS